MTKKDYELIAGAIHRCKMVAEINKNRTKREAEQRMLRLVATDLGASLKHDNPKFDGERFRDYCGI
jgi:hypothetical protein